ncbi:hypothetical protein EZI54_15165 [Marinobacter halodurans]|uniref:SPOR domain-containing protein n=1 Tax=Marinobacter halodurans TaxID=2528979 RepID=A0ABY1ZKI3_9GAMM|nr:hypothetical protein [Marinobacter halodurans]TBW53321.1 hypothetical protein EZI54_15165 [Marinobacter halodurans]
MNSAMNGHFKSPDQAKNVWDDLIATGIPRDNIYIDEDQQVIKVMIPEEERREIQEIFDRHRLS